MYQSSTRWRWPAVIVLSAGLVALFTFGDIHSPLRLPIALWFLAVCPGMALIRPLRLTEKYVQLTLAVAVSLALETMVAVAITYAAAWSAAWSLAVLIGISLGGVALDITTSRNRTGRWM